MSDSKVFICVLCGPERYQWIAPDLMQSLVETQHHKGISVDVNTVYGVHGYDAARNLAVEKFLESDADWLCMIDNDNVPPSGFVERVMEFVNWRPTVDNVPQADFVRHFMEFANRPSVDIVSLPYHLRPNVWFPDIPTLSIGFNAELKWEDDLETAFWPAFVGPGWQEIHISGAGCFFIRRGVLTSFSRPWFRIPRSSELNGDGEDSDFCLRARRAGFHIWTNPELFVDHYHTVSLSALARLARHGKGPTEF